MRKILITTGCDPREPWKAVLDLTVPRMEKYASLHGYDFKALWYHDVEHRYAEFHNPEPYVHGAAAYEVRKDFINWSVDRGMLAPNWIRYAAVLMLLEEYDVIVYMDGDLVIANFEKDVIADMPPEKWLGASICGPSPDNAGPGGPLFITRSCPASKNFWLRVWEGKKWLAHPNWTDGVDFMDLLGYSIMPPVHRVRTTEYDSAFYQLPPDWIAWGAHPEETARFYHISAGLSGDAERKLTYIKAIIEERGN
jgi:hypothetical protein